MSKELDGITVIYQRVFYMEPHVPQASHSSHEHDIYIQALLLLVMITSSMNLHHYLHHKNFTYLSETAINLLTGNFQLYRFSSFIGMD
jgi:hypothetical protein